MAPVQLCQVCPGLCDSRREISQLNHLPDPASRSRGTSDEVIQKSLALQSVRLLVHDMFGNALRHLETGAPLDRAWNDKLMSSVAYLTEVAEEATLFAYRAAGSQGLRNPSRVQECFRDIMTGGRHLFVDKRSYEEFTKTTLGIQG